MADTQSRVCPPYVPRYWPAVWRRVARFAVCPLSGHRWVTFPRVNAQRCERCTMLRDV